MFQLIFKGERVQGTDEQAARANAMALFKATTAQVDRMFSGQRVVIRNRLDEATALKYQAVLRKNGLLAHVEPMEGQAGAPPESPREAGREPEAAAPQAAAASASAGRAESGAAGGVRVEPGDRLDVAGEKVDEILSHSSLTVDAPGARLSEEHQVEAPHFEHLDEITVAPAGADIGEAIERPPAPVPDTSHLSLADDPQGTSS